MAKKAAPAKRAAQSASMQKHEPGSKAFKANEPGDQYIFVDGARGFALSGGVGRFLLTQEIYDPEEGGPYSVPATRIAMPLPSFFTLHKWMTDIIKHLAEQGISFEEDAPDDVK